MKAMMWKEWRENARWALLGGIVLALACAWMLHQVFSAATADPWQMVWTQGLMPFTLLAPVIGAALGFLQIIPEMRRDQWAFLVHRPVSRGAIFFGKAVAGLRLYLLATVIPLLGLVLWLNVPGHLPGPFLGRLILPAIADIIGGVVFYFAAIVTALRAPHSRRHFSRALCFPAAMGCQFLLSVVPQFWQALLLAAIFLGIVGAAAWGAFLSTGDFDTQPKSAKSALITTLYVGTAILISCAIAVVVSLFPGENRNFSYSEYKVDSQGRILRVTQGFSPGMAVSDVNGKTVPPVAGTGWDWSSFLSPASVYLRSEAPTIGYRDPRRYAIAFPIAYPDNNVVWFYARDEHLLLGYDRLRHDAGRLLGTLGPDGYLSAGGAHSRLFEGELLNFSWDNRSRVLHFPHSAYWLDLKNRSIKSLSGASDTQPVLGVSDFSTTNFGPQHSPWGAVVAKAKQIHVFSAEGAPILVAPLEYPVADYPSVSIYPLPKNRASIWYYPAYSEGQVSQMPIRVTEISTRGHILKRTALPPLSQGAFSSYTSPYPMALLVPPSAIAVTALYATARGSAGGELSKVILKSMKADETAWLIFTLISVTVALFCAMLAWFIGKRCAVDGRTRWIWAIGVLLSGFFGLLTLLMLRDWPFRETCASCGKKRIVQREACEHCGAGFPTPALDGTEIFA